MSSRFVAPRTMTWESSLRLSSSLKNWLTTRSTAAAPSLVTLRVTPRVSISSKKRMQGADCLAFLKIWCRAFSDSPSHLENRVGTLMEMKFSPVSPARALAMRVLPVPDGPEKRMPRGGMTFAFANRSGYLDGHSTMETRVSLIVCRPPMWCHRTVERSVKNSRVAVGSTSRRALRKSSIVICSCSVDSSTESRWFSPSRER